LKHFLTPTPLNETGKWEDVKEKEFAVKNAASTIGMVGLMRSLSDLTAESKLLMITAFLNVCVLKGKEPDEKEMMIKKLFARPKKGDRRTGVNIFDQWKQEAKETLDRLAQVKTEDEEWFSCIVAYRILVQYIKLIAACGFFIDTKKKLDILNEKSGVAWNQPDYLNDVSIMPLFPMRFTHV